MCAYPGDDVASPEKVVAEINKLYAYVEALKASLLSLVGTVAKAGNDHGSRIEALETATTCPHIVSSDEGTSYCRLAEQHTAPTTKARPGGFFPVEYVDADGDGIRILMEPAEETGQACWVVRNSRRVSPFEEFPTPEAAYAAHQTRAEQAPEPATTMDELRAASAEARPGGLVEPEITRRELARIWNDNQDPNEESGDAMARLYSAGFHAGIKWQAHLAQQGAAPAAEARPGGLMERMRDAVYKQSGRDPTSGEMCAAIREVAAWLEARGSAHWLSVAVLRREANR